MILLLGATGLLGRNVLQLLLERGIPVRALVRRDLPVEGVEVVRGSVLSREDLLNAARGCSAIINCAGSTDMTLPRVGDFYPVNRDLPAMLLKVLETTGIRTLIDTSTANTIASGTPERPATEQCPFGPPFDRSPYALSKCESEALLLDYAQAHPERRILIMNPGFMLGGWDSKPSSGQLMLAGYRRPVMIAFSGGKSFLHVKDAATAIVNALDKGESGRYLLTGRYISLKDFYLLQARVMGYRQKVWELPDWLTLSIGRLGNLLLKLGIRNTFYWHNIRQMLWQEWYSCNKARRVLDYPQTPVEQGIKDFFAYWKKSRSAS